jgi:hypothetical protein
VFIYEAGGGVKVFFVGGKENLTTKIASQTSLARYDSSLCSAAEPVTRHAFGEYGPTKNTKGGRGDFLPQRAQRTRRARRVPREGITLKLKTDN